MAPLKSLLKRGCGLTIRNGSVFYFFEVFDV